MRWSRRKGAEMVNNGCVGASFSPSSRRMPQERRGARDGRVYLPFVEKLPNATGAPATYGWNVIEAGAMTAVVVLR